VPPAITDWVADGSLARCATQAGERPRQLIADAGYWRDDNAALVDETTEILIATTKAWKQRQALREQGSPNGRIPGGDDQGPDGADAADPSRAGDLHVAELHHRTGLWANAYTGIATVLAAGPREGHGGVVAVV
jgi:hypothetical protein